jgi:hypothetical protein
LGAAGRISLKRRTRRLVYRSAVACTSACRNFRRRRAAGQTGTNAMPPAGGGGASTGRRPREIPTICGDVGGRLEIQPQPLGPLVSSIAARPGFSFRSHPNALHSGNRRSALCA